MAEIVKRCLISTAIVLFATSLWPAAVRGATGPEYVGSRPCKACHKDQANDTTVSGHPHKLRKAEEARHAGIPLPEGYTWDDISYVIGGHIWKARYIDKEGYIITSTGPKKDIRAKNQGKIEPGKNQYNVKTGTWSDYHPGEKKKYDCGACHTTGYKKEGHQDGMPGIVGTWSEPGVQCEACHGPGGDHIGGKGYKGNIKVDRSAAACGACHVRGKPNTIPASGGFIRHHEQYNEILASPHGPLGCVTCHDPHKTAKFSIRAKCEVCHPKQAQEFAGSAMQRGNVQCMDCHMPEATKSAEAQGKYRGDVKTHLFKINLDPNARMFTADGNFANGFLTVEFACLGCHSGETRSWAFSKSKGIHSYGKY
jgi:formate-dependent nitrite reductase cytochrome c552 subunit